MGIISGSSTFLRNPSDSQAQTAPPRRRQGSDVPLSPHAHKQPRRRPRIAVAVLEGVGLRDFVENTKCQAGGQTAFKCFKMQITTGFKFSLSPLVKTKVEAGLPKSHRAAVCFSGAWPRRHQLQRGMELMAPSQIDRASWAVGRTDSVSSYQNWVSKARAGRWGDWDREPQMAGRQSVNQALHPKGLKKARERAARGANYLSTYGQLEKGGGQTDQCV